MDSAFFTTTVIGQGQHFTHMWKHLHDPIISLRREIWAHKISLAPQLFIEVPVPSQESE